jgi:hypothetical protein
MSKILSSVRRVTVAATLALAAVLLAGCGGGGDNQGKVEAGLQHYLVNLAPGDNPFLVGAGATPRVKDNSCKDRHVMVEKRHLIRSQTFSFGFEIPVALWTCVVKVGTVAMPVNVVVDDRTEVVIAVPGGLLKEDKTGSQSG